MVTPLDIQKHQFSVKFKGFDREEVRHFLYAVSEEMESLLEQNQQMARESAVLREKVRMLSSRDKALKDTLVTAQQMKSDIHQNAEREAELLLKDAQLKADAYYDEAKKKVDQLLQQIGELRRVRNDILAETEMMVSRFTHFVEAEAELAQESDKLHNFVAKRVTRTRAQDDPAPRPYPAKVKKSG